MALNEDIDVLSAAGLFEQLSSEQLRLLAFGAERLRFNVGRKLYRQGDRADCGYVIAVGTVALTRQSGGADPVVIKSVEPGTVLGELALITETHWITGAQAQTDVEVLRINRSLFRRMLSEYPDTASAIRDQLKADLKAFVDDIARIEQKLRSVEDL